jgi:hypothetical protein
MSAPYFQICFSELASESFDAPLSALDLRRTDLEKLYSRQAELLR